jgi:hypothetical protein
LARFFRQVRCGKHSVNGVDCLLRFSRAQQVRDVIQGARVRTRLCAQQSGGEQEHGSQGGHAAAPGTAEGAPAGAGKKGEDQADQGRNGKDDVTVIRHAAHFLPPLRDVQAVRNVLDEAVERGSVRELHILAVRLPGQVLQAFRIELGNDVLAAAVAVKAGGGLFIRNGGADGGADARRDDDEFMLPGGFCRLVGDVDGVFTVAQDDQGVSGVRLLVPLEGLEGQPNDVFQVGSPLGDPAELKLFNGFLQRVVVMGEGHEQNGVPGEDDDAEVVPRQGVQQVIGGGFSPSQAGGGGVLAEHGAGAVNGNQDVARFGDFPYFRVSIHRARNGEDGEDGSQHGKDNGEHPVPGGRSVNQLLPVFRGDEHFPFSGTAAPQPPGRRCQQGGEDKRVQNVGIKEGHGGEGMVLRRGGGFEHLQGEAQKRQRGARDKEVHEVFLNVADGLHLGLAFFQLADGGERLVEGGHVGGPEVFPARNLGYFPQGGFIKFTLHHHAVRQGAVFRPHGDGINLDAQLGRVFRRHQRGYLAGVGSAVRHQDDDF